MNKLKILTIMAVSSVAACTSTISKNIQKDGTVDGEVTFPDIEKATMKQGTFPNVQNLNTVAAGVTKKQLYHLLGRPHFKERIGAREWDYLFNFRQADGSVAVCQFKVIFDKHKIGQSFFYKPEDCAANHIVATPAPKALVAAAAVTPETKTTASVDIEPVTVYFGFDKRDSLNLHPNERAKLIAMVREYRQSHNDMPQINLSAYTDRIGTDAYNEQLAQNRAETIKAYLVSLGLDGELITMQALGASDAVIEHCEQQDFVQLTECLAPNRRVIVTISQ